MLDKLKDLNNLRKLQANVKKEMEKIFISEEKRGVAVRIRGDKRIESIIVDGEEQEVLKDLLNDTMKKVDKKVEKQARGYLGDFGLPGF